MLKKLSFTDLLAGVQKKVEQNTELRCYDAMPLDAPLPCYYCEIVGQSPNNTKTMYCEMYQVYLHAFADGINGSMALFGVVKMLEEALTEEIILPAKYHLVSQDATGLQQILDEEDKTKHAIMGYQFRVSYGYMCK